MSPVLKLTSHDEKKERIFELNHLLLLSTKERFQMMIQKSNEIKKSLIRHGYRKSTEIIKRECR